MRPLFGTSFSISEGIFLIFNRIFMLSEERQMYRYIMFAVGSPGYTWGASIAAALIVISVLFALVSLNLALARRRVLLVVLLALVVGTQVYFGVFASPFWNIFLFSVFGLLLARGANFKAAAYIGGAVLLVSAAVFIIFPGQNPQLHEFSESLRDRFGSRINPFAVEPFTVQGSDAQTEAEQQHLNVIHVQEDTLHYAGHYEYAPHYEDVAQGTDIGLAVPQASLLPAVIFVLVLLAAALAWRYIPPLMRAARRRQLFSQSDSSAAIDCMFVYMLDWLGVHGLKRGNVVFTAYAPQLGELVSPQYSDEYMDAAVLWQRAVYSAHTPGEAERQHMKAFLDKTADIVWKSASLRTKLKIKLHYFL